MSTKVLKASFDLHQAGGTAEDKAEAAAQAADDTARASVASGAAVLTDINRDFVADGVTTDYKATILSGAGNIIRSQVTITNVAATTITVGGGNFDTTEGGILYLVYLPPTTAQIADDPTKRGTGLVGYQEWLQAIETNDAIDLETKLIDLHYAEGLTQQVIVYDETA
jgi:hypothetical protein